MVRAFRLAPMSALLWALTVPVLAVPVLFAVLGTRAPAPVSAVLWTVAGLLGLLYVGVWGWARPTRFEVGADGLVIVWPARRRRIPRHDVAGARLLAPGEFRREFGLAVRVGVGGLWGGFGWVWTSRGGMLDLYVSRTDGCVLVERRAGRPLLLTPEHPDQFVRALGAS
jgi:Bacterial PH domain